MARSRSPASGRNALNDLDAREWVRLTKSWFVADGRPADISDEIDLHPASFPPDLVARFIRFFTQEGETVLDPFVGTGSVLVAAHALGRKGIGVELNPTYYENTVRRVRQLPEGHPAPVVLQGDARDLYELVMEPLHFCITSPPYWDMLKRSRGNVDSVHKRRASQGLHTDYGDDSRDLGSIDDYGGYLEELREVFRKVRGLMLPGRYLVVVAQNVRPPDGEMRPLAWDLARALQQDWVLQQEFVWCQNQKPLGCWGYPSAYVSNVHHHYCLVLKNSREANGGE